MPNPDSRDIIFHYQEEKGRCFIEKNRLKKPLFVCVLATTDTAAAVPGLSIAGANPQLTYYTPAADAELLHYGCCKSISGVPMTPDGIPTPALITLAALRTVNMPLLIVDAGMKILPMVPYVVLGKDSGCDIRGGLAVPNAEEIFEYGKALGEMLARMSEFIVIAESIPGGTTTALAVMLALGMDAKGKVSSTMTHNPHDLKNKVADEALEAAGIVQGTLRDSPLKAVKHVGDPMLAGTAGLVVGAAGRTAVMLAGGTQMAGVLAVAHCVSNTITEDLTIATTRWLVEDPTSDIRGLVKQIAPVPILAANLSFANSVFPGLRAYETGIVKEGVGAGGACVAAMMWNQKLSMRGLIAEIEKTYGALAQGR